MKIIAQALIRADTHTHTHTHNYTISHTHTYRAHKQTFIHTYSDTHLLRYTLTCKLFIFLQIINGKKIILKM